VSADRRYETLVGLITSILQKLDDNDHALIDIRADLDRIDRTLRPYGDGTREPTPRRRRR
jgi:hypothetical protein